MTALTAFRIALVLDVLWFGAAFVSFFLRPYSAAKLLVPKSARHTPMFATIAESIRFLGGMNGSFAVLALWVLVEPPMFPEAAQQALFAGVFALAHASQFAGNLPVAWRGGRQGEAFWPVLSGPMLFIFTVDIALMLVNAAVAVALQKR